MSYTETEMRAKTPNRHSKYGAEPEVPPVKRRPVFARGAPTNTKQVSSRMSTGIFNVVEKAVVAILVGLFAGGLTADVFFNEGVGPYTIGALFVVAIVTLLSGLVAWMLFPADQSARSCW